MPKFDIFGNLIGPAPEGFKVLKDFVRITNPDNGASLTVEKTEDETRAVLERTSPDGTTRSVEIKERKAPVIDHKP